MAVADEMGWAQPSACVRPKSSRLAGRGVRPASCWRPSSPPEALGPRRARSHGFNLHASVTVREGDRAGLERLCRYLARPPLSDDRLERLDEEHIGLQLETPYSDGTEMIALSHAELIERLCALVPRPRRHRVHYHGVLAPATRHRRLVVPNPPPSARSAGAPTPAPSAAAVGAPVPLIAAPLATRRRTVRRLLRAELLRRTFDTDPLLCPQCGGRMKTIASIHQAEVVCAILESHGLPTEASFIRPSRGPPESDLWEVWW